MQDTGTPAPSCKCCGGAAVAFGAADRARSCEADAFPASGEAVPYLRCVACGFVFTDYFDGWSDARMSAEIYNAEYVRADPDFVAARPQYFAGRLRALLGDMLRDVRGLDFGGGGGLLARLMCEAGAARYDSYDPFLGDAAAPSGSYALVTAFEVMEHSRDPAGTMRAALTPLTDDGALLFSTLLRPRGAGPAWWYIAPRNGHVSIHTAASLAALCRRCGLRVVTLEEGLHLAYRKPGAIPRRVLHDAAGGALHHASLAGPTALLQTAAAVFGAGGHARALDPRHAARALRAALFRAGAERR